MHEINAGDVREAIKRLKNGLPPGNSEITRSISAGIDFVSDFLREKYLLEYVGHGGGKIKFITGRQGSGKSHLLELMRADAVDLGYKTAAFSSKDIWLHDFKEIYFAVLESVDLMECLKGCRDAVIKEMGFSPGEIPEEQSFADYLAGNSMLDAMTKRELRETISRMFLKNPMMDNNFAYACVLLTGYLLGYPTLEEPSKELVLGWLAGSKEAKLPALRKLGLSPVRITKYNARHMLRSLAQVVRAAGHKGLFIAVDDLDILVSDDSLEELHYTKNRREDAYESLRQLIDDSDTLCGIFFAFAFRRELLDDDRRGVKSYQALWMRIQNEVSSDRFNRFADVIDLDALAKQEYGPETVLEISAKLAEALGRYDDGVKPMQRDEAVQLLEGASFGKIALPRQINLATTQRMGATV